MSAPSLVADSGPLIALARIDLLSIPARIFRETLVTATVWTEVMHAPREGELAALAAAYETGLLHVVDDPAEVPPGLAGDLRIGAGERSAIALTVARQATVLVDERRGRAAATAFGLPVVGTLGLLVRARDDGLIERVRPLTDALLASGYFLARPLVEQALAAVGE